jgi:hypothetical protein
MTSITEQTTLGELAAQRTALGISAMLLFIDPDSSKRRAIVYSRFGSFAGEGNTEAQAIEAAFAALRREMGRVIGFGRQLELDV